MSISVERNGRLFTIHTAHTTYQMLADDHDVLLHLYYGRRSEGCGDYLLTYADHGFSGNIYDAGSDRTYSLDFMPQEYPCSGSGDFRSPAVRIADSNGIEWCDLRYSSYEVISGKYSLPGLPAVYAEDGDEAVT
ncbi:MAG: glycoside hydrolase family 36 N-terminal domain-containing protein, partial [Lachnospiraceae bacterium]|nr:glycoside hydrolase family 36 N-terminal domain-containing protein [Lachnospiraceae bacterium]